MAPPKQDRKQQDDPVEKDGNKKDECGGDMEFGRHAKMPFLVTDLYAQVDIPQLQWFEPDKEMCDPHDEGDEGVWKLDSTLIFCGKRRTGKTFAMRSLLWHVKDVYPAGIVISSTAELNHFWQEHFPACYVYNEYNPAILDAVFVRQKKILEDPDLSDEEKEKQARFLIILDDVIADISIRNERNLRELFVAGRHYRISTWVSTQYAKGLDPTLRGNTDLFFIFKTVQRRQLESMHEDFCDFLTLQGFSHMLSEYTENNGIIIVSTAPENEVSCEGMLYSWKAVDPGPFLFGSKEFWESSEGIDAASMQMPPPATDRPESHELLNVHALLPSWANATLAKAWPGHQ